MAIDTGIIQGGADAMAGSANFISKAIRWLFSAENIYFGCLCIFIFYITIWWIMRQAKMKGKVADAYAHRRRDV